MLSYAFKRFHMLFHSENVQKSKTSPPPPPPPTLTKDSAAARLVKKPGLELQYILIDLSVGHKKSVKSLVIESGFVSVENLILTLWGLTEKWRV